jgi:hypothetical protein
MSWIPFKEVDFSDTNINAYHVDTRDFGCTSNDHKPELDLRKVDKNSEYYEHTAVEVQNLLQRLYEESGGEGEWRMLTLEGEDFRTGGWQMKYIRIYRLHPSAGLLVTCGHHNDTPFIMSKSMLASKVEQKYLNHH